MQETASSTSRRKEPPAPPDPYAKLAELVKLLCNSGGPAPDPELLKALKRELKRGDDGATRRAHAALLHALTHRECSTPAPT